MEPQHPLPHPTCPQMEGGAWGRTPKNEDSCSCLFVMAKCTPMPGAPQDLLVRTPGLPGRSVHTRGWKPAPRAAQPDPEVSPHTRGTGTRANHRKI